MTQAGTKTDKMNFAKESWKSQRWQKMNDKYGKFLREGLVRKKKKCEISHLVLWIYKGKKNSLHQNVFQLMCEKK